MTKTKEAVGTIPVGLDAGNDSIKVKTDGGIYFVPNVVKYARRARKVSIRGDEGDAIDYLDVTVNLNDRIKGNYYVGSLAAQSGDSIESLGGLKCENDELLVAMITGMVYALYKEHKENHYKIVLCTGLPAEEFYHIDDSGNYDFAYVEKHTDRIAGTHKIKFNSKHPELNNQEITLEISKKNISILPEGYGALMSILYGENGEHLYPEYKNKNVFTLDIGGGTSDVAAINGTTPIPAAMFGIPEGVGIAQDNLCSKIRAQAALPTFTRYDLNQYLFSSDIETKGKLETNKAVIDLNKEKIPFYEEVTDNLVYNFKLKFRTEKLAISMVNVLFLIGGGAIELADMVKERLINDIPTIILRNDGRIKNAEGYLRAAKILQEEE